MRKKKFKYTNNLVSLFFVFLFVFFSVVNLLSLPIVNAFAVTADNDSIYTDVLDDLNMAEDFSTELYPGIVDDYSISVIQIAECSSNELFIYVYQPSAETKELRAVSINISTAINDNLKYNNYKLTFLNANGVFAKYKVEGLELKEDVVRYYDISSILRLYDANIDLEPENDNVVTEIAYSVGQQWTACTLNDEVHYSCLESETITITDKFVGFVRYPGGFNLFSSGACDSHFVAFSTDHDIDRLYEADIYYTTQERTYNDVYYGNVKENAKFGDVEEHKTTLNYKEKTEYTGSGLFSHSYKWDRIQTVEDFKESVEEQEVFKCGLVNVTTENKISDYSDIDDKQFILRFTETTYTSKQFTGSNGLTQYAYSACKNTKVADVMILRLKFETDGVVYNLGVVDNKQTGSDDPINDYTWGVELDEDFKKLLKLVGVVVLVILALAVVVFLSVFTPFLKVVGSIVFYLFKGILWIISSPFYLFKKIKKE